MSGGCDGERPPLLGSLSRDPSHTETISSTDTPEIVSAHRGSRSQSQLSEQIESPESQELKDDDAQDVTALGPDSCSIGIDE